MAMAKCRLTPAVMIIVTIRSTVPNVTMRWVRSARATRQNKKQSSGSGVDETAKKVWWHWCMPGR